MRGLLPRGPACRARLTPYLFKFQIVGHGMSNATEAFVTFGE